MSSTIVVSEAETPSHNAITPSSSSSSGEQGPNTRSSNTSMTAKMNVNSSLQDLQTEEQRRVLDTVSQIRKCGLDSVLSLPQIVVCGDQSAGKSSVLEALTEIPFPRSDNLCIRFATEISLGRDQVDSLTIRVIPDSARPEAEQTNIKAFSEKITDFSELPTIMENAEKILGVSESGSAFARDVLSIDICGPERPQLTIVDIPGLIQASTKGVSEADVKMAGENTEHYIKQPRIICLAIISATNDAANQPILTKVRQADPNHDRTLGVITKLDKLDAGSGSEDKFLQLARNEDVRFKHDWHAIRNRNFKECGFSFEERNLAEEDFFTTSTFSCLDKKNVGIGALRKRLSQLLFDHIKKELPRLQKELESTLKTNQKALKTIGSSRFSERECRTFLVRFNTECYELSKATLDGNYGHSHFRIETPRLPTPPRRLRAAIQFQNQMFAETLRIAGHSYIINEPNQDCPQQAGPLVVDIAGLRGPVNKVPPPEAIPTSRALHRVRLKLAHSRGTELVGNFNLRVIAELFWDHSQRWQVLAESHIQDVHNACAIFLNGLLCNRAPNDLHDRLRKKVFLERLGHRKAAAQKELEKLLEDLKGYPINYNHYYTDNIQKKRRERLAARICQHLPTRSRTNDLTGSKKLVEQTLSSWSEAVDPNSEDFACEEALDCMLALYKDIFAPMVAHDMPADDLEALIREPATTQRERTYRADLVHKLEEGQKVLKEVMGGRHSDPQVFARQS